MKKIILLLLFLVSNIQAADFVPVSENDCSNTDIRDHHPELKEFFSTPRDQESISWCYGFVAADLLSVEVGRPVSALHMSSIFNKSVASDEAEQKKYSSLKGRSFRYAFEYGFTDKALEAALTEGAICPEETLPFESKIKKDATVEMIKTIESVKVQCKDTDKVHLKEELKTVLPKNDYGDLNYNRILRIIKKKDINVSLEKIASLVCKGHQIKIPPLRVVTFDKLKPTKETTDSYLNVLNKALTLGKPVGIYFDTKYINKKSFNHQSSIIGRKWENNKCHFRLRNSWGDYTGSYLPETKIDPADYSVWVTDETLDKMSDHLTYLESTSKKRLRKR